MVLKFVLRAGTRGGCSENLALTSLSGLFVPPEPRGENLIICLNAREDNAADLLLAFCAANLVGVVAPTCLLFQTIKTDFEFVVYIPSSENGSMPRSSLLYCRLRKLT
jgi:hypothetical protein